MSNHMRPMRPGAVIAQDLPLAIVSKVELVLSAPVCQWFALCTNVATHVESHPVLGDVPTCDRCADRLQVGTD